MSIRIFFIELGKRVVVVCEYPDPPVKPLKWLIYLYLSYLQDFFLPKIHNSAEFIHNLIHY